ncbi:hypothetical protein JTB14_015098 [Gonioctena quinquepunctata]|nr:hypothetical protein JTB14_015098 [Gonioctena quinquepunctata]
MFNKKITLTAVYRSPSSNAKDFNNSLITYLSGLEYQDVEIFIGDININIISAKPDDIIEEYLNVLNTSGQNITDHSLIMTRMKLKPDRMKQQREKAQNRYYIDQVPEKLLDE